MLVKYQTNRFKMVLETALTIPRCVVVILVLVGIGGFLAYTLFEDINDTSGGINEASAHPRDHISPYPDEIFHHIQWFVQVTVYLDNYLS